jgi:hypothetical protein
VAGFNPNASLRVAALALASDALYVSGDFNNIGTQARSRLAALNLTTGVALDFQASPTFVDMGDDTPIPPNALAISGDVLYVGGNFTHVSGTARNRLAALNRTTGALTDWNPGADAAIQALTVSGDNIYVAGDFQNIGTTARKYLAALNKQGTLLDWAPQPGAAVTGIAADDDTIYAFGTTIRSFGVEPHAKLAAFKDGALTKWGPAVSGGNVSALAISGGTIYVGGDFTMIGGVARVAAAAVSDANVVRDWNAQIATESGTAIVRAIVADNNRVYLGGAFDAAGGGANKNVAAVTGDTAATLSGWTLTGARGGGSVFALALDGSDLYLGGSFLTLSTASTTPNRVRLAKVNADTGAVSSWDPGANGLVQALVVVGSNLVAGGDFTQLDASAHTRLGAVDKTSGDADNTWNLVVDGAVLALTKVDSVLYVGGAFENIGTLPADAALHFAVFDYDQGAFTRVTSAFGVSGSVAALAVDTNHVYLGGTTLSAEGTSCRFYCARERPLPPL